MKFKVSRSMLTCAAVLCTFSSATSASIINHYYGIEVEAKTDEIYVDHNIGRYEITLGDSLALNYTDSFSSDYSIYTSRDLININWQQDARGNVYIDDADINMSFAAGFEAQDHADAFVDSVENKTTIDTITNGILSGSPIAGRLLDMDLEAEQDQLRTTSSSFAQQMEQATGYSNYSLSLSFDFLSDLSMDMTMLDIALYESLYSPYEDFDYLSSIVAVEHDMYRNFSTDNGAYYSGQFSRKLWFDSLESMQAAEQFFVQDISDLNKSGNFSGEMLNDVLNNEHFVINRDIQISNVDFTASSKNRVAVNEPTTLLILSSALVMLGLRRQFGKNR